MARLLKHEKPLSKADGNKNNPNEIVLNQHVIPCKHLLEWSLDGKMVSLVEVASKNEKYLPANCAYFCVMRLWDQWTETKMLKSNEDNFQSQAELIKNGVDTYNKEFLMAYYVLLCVRVWVANKERPHYPSQMENLSYEASKAELEQNEIEMDGPAHFILPTSDPDSQHMAREVVKMAMNQAFLQWTRHMESETWYLYESDDESFILSDSFYNNFMEKFHVLPINPKQVLIANSTYLYLKANDQLSSSYINQVMERNAVNYYVKVEGSPEC
ncbi:hypothetical protein KW481_09895 [Vibrio fluvialis]|nr:hypothetical protein [Vibrio fluvialis]MBY8192606.1 hypothetical protein [Vibrio fluvialis]